MTLMPTERQEGMKVKKIYQCGTAAQAHTVRTSGKWIAPNKELWDQLENSLLGLSHSSKMSTEY